MKAPELKEKLEESEKLIRELTITWEEKLRKTEAIAQVSHIGLLAFIELTKQEMIYFFVMPTCIYIYLVSTG